MEVNNLGLEVSSVRIENSKLKTDRAKVMDFVVELERSAIRKLMAETGCTWVTAFGLIRDWAKGNVEQELW